MAVTDSGSRQSHAADWAASVCTASVFLLDLLLERGGHAPLHWMGIGCLLLGGLLSFPPMFTLRRYGRVEEGGSYMATTVLVDRGLFAVVRHPQYLGYMCLTLGFMLLSQRWPTVVVGIAGIVLFRHYAIAEERILGRRFGAGYAEYCRRVPRFNLVLGLARQVMRRR